MKLFSFSMPLRFFCRHSCCQTTFKVKPVQHVKFQWEINPPQFSAIMVSFSSMATATCQNCEISQAKSSENWRLIFSETTTFFESNCTNDATKHKGNTLPETNTSHLKIGLPNRKVVFQPSIFRGYVSFREGKLPKPSPIPSSDVLHPVSMVSHKLWIEKPYAKNLESDPPPMRIKGHSIHFFVVKIRKFSVGQWTLSEVSICVHFPSKPVPTLHSTFGHNFSDVWIPSFEKMLLGRLGSYFPFGSQ